ncbi:sulfite exporter TauE/SafE family protein [Pseudaestuariivita sp.]|uniref:sulfite exporter TauE/SafE family protein n=1 Tax=Pseudaestuariivita sp. TaxID=2211669 RepID=UPI00405802ED
MPVDPLTIILAVAGILIGGVMKGATGAGAPVIAVPMLAVAFDVPTAVAIFTIPNLLSNGWQTWRHHAHQVPDGFARAYALAGLGGAATGTLLLVALAPALLEGLAALVICVYIVLRLALPDWKLSLETAQRLVWPVGAAGGVLQGAIGVSAPISVTFLNAMRLERLQFVATISLFFLAMSLVQIPLMAWFGLLTLPVALLGLGAFALLALAMPVGAAIARRLPPQAFDWLIVGLLAVVAVRLGMSALSPSG